MNFGDEGGIKGGEAICGKTGKGLAVSFDGVATGLVLSSPLSPAGDSIGKAGWVVGEFLVGLEVGTGELECGNFGMTGGEMSMDIVGGDATGAVGTQTTGSPDGAFPPEESVGGGASTSAIGGLDG